jgi:hypothetical protein
VMRIDETYHRNQSLKRLKAIFSSFANEQPADNQSAQVRPWQN